MTSWHIGVLCRNFVFARKNSFLRLGVYNPKIPPWLRPWKRCVQPLQPSYLERRQRFWAHAALGTCAAPLSFLNFSPSLSCTCKQLRCANNRYRSVRAGIVSSTQWREQWTCLLQRTQPCAFVKQFGAKLLHESLFKKKLNVKMNKNWYCASGSILPIYSNSMFCLSCNSLRCPSLMTKRKFLNFAKNMTFVTNKNYYRSALARLQQTVYHSQVNE